MAEPVKLEITFFPDNGKVAVNGPIQNKILCYGMLESAKKAVADYDPEEQPGIIIPDRTRFNLPQNGEATGH